MKAYVDSSVLLRLLLGEPGGLDRSELIAPVTSVIARLECFRTADRLRMTRALDDVQVSELRQALNSELQAIEQLAMTRAVLRVAESPFPTVVRSLDAIHLATALLVRQRDGEELVFATHDVQQSVAARAFGFRVVGV